MEQRRSRSLTRQGRTGVETDTDQGINVSRRGRVGTERLVQLTTGCYMGAAPKFHSCGELTPCADKYRAQIKQGMDNNERGLTRVCLLA